MTVRNARIISIVVVVFSFLVSAWAWGQIPADQQVPVHWNAQGEVDGYAGKAFGLLLMPVLTAAMALLFAVIPRFEPRRLNLERSEAAYSIFWMAMMLFFAALHVLLVLAALGNPVDIGLFVWLLVAALFIVIGLVLSSVESNFFFGVRTPWTLSSERSWRKTHRLGGYLFVGLGALIIVGALAGNPDVMVWLIIGGALTVVAITYGYSYLVWRTDPDKMETGRTL